MSAHANDLASLLARWAEAHPEECHLDAGIPPLHICPAIDRELTLGGGAGDNADAALVLGAVVYHAARRGLHLSTWVAEDQESYLYGVFAGAADPDRHDGLIEHKADTERGDGAAALRALACAALAAYLDALTPLSALALDGEAEATTR